MKRTKSVARKREILYRDFITEAARLLADAFDHSLDRPETLVNRYANLGRIRLFSLSAVYNAAEERCNRILDVYAGPNRTADHLIATIRSGDLGFFRKFSDACRLELRNYTAY
jgi:hypothetical protein